jgi:hydrogenase-4 component F
MTISLQTLVQFTFWLPLFTVIASFLIAWVLGKRQLLLAERFLRVITVSTSLVLLITSVLMLFTNSKEAGFSLYIPVLNAVDFHVDALSIFLILLINAIAFAASWNSLAYLDGIPGTSQGKWWQQKTWFHVLINLFHFTMLLVPLADNLVVVWIAIELTTVGSALLIVYEGKKSSWEATWKYLVITSTGIVLALLGTIFLASHPENAPIVEKASSPNELLDWTFLMKHASELEPNLVWFAFLFALVGYGTKAGLAPLHTWLPDGHGEAPAPISALLSGVLLKASFYVILRFYTLTNAVLGRPEQTSAALLIAGLLSLLVSTPFILKENPFKRVLAYHSLEHMGIIAFGFGIGGPIAVSGALLHMLNHAVTKALMFLSHGNIVRKYAKDGMSTIAGALRRMPWSGGMLTLGGLALVGTPPFNIFVSELIILWGALSRFVPGKFLDGPNYHPLVSAGAITIFVLSTTLIFYGLVNHLKKIVLGSPEKDGEREKFTWPALAPTFFLFVLMLVTGIWIVPPLANLVHESVQILLQLPE